MLIERAFAIERLARHVELTASVLRSSELGDVGDRAGARISEAVSALIN